MNHQSLLSSVIAMALTAVVTALGAAEPAPAQSGQPAPGTGAPVVLLKLDDLAHAPGGPTATVPPRWQKVTDFLAANNVVASYGIIGESLEGDYPTYIAWIKALHDQGRIEFWNHGYLGRFPKTPTLSAFAGTPLEQQREFLDKTQGLAKAKLGFELKAFGPHDSAVDDNTYRALAGHPEITMVFYYPPVKDKSLATQFVFERKLNLEEPIFSPNPASVKERFAKYGHALPYLCMQGHPNQWDEARFAAFSETVLWLKAQGCVFMRPSEYVASRKNVKAATAVAAP